MKRFVHRLVTNRLGRLRICALIALMAVAAGMLWPRGGALAPAGARWPADALKGFAVALDPGHGGYDGGARARDSGLWEKELTLAIALEIERELLARGAAVTLTRREDASLDDGGSGKARKRADLRARMDAAEAAGADVLVSVHMNEYRSRAESGPQVFYQRGGDDGRLLAGALQAALIAGLDPPKKRVAMAGDYFVLRGSLPSALVECGFLSNAREEKLLLDADYQRRIAASVADGLCEYRALLAAAKPTPGP